MRKALLVIWICLVLCVLLSNSATRNSDLRVEKVRLNGHGSAKVLSPEDPKFWIYLAISCFLVVFAGLCSGLTVGYLSIDSLSLEVKSKTGTALEQKQAACILPILAQHHKLLATLLVSNAFAMEALPIFLHALVPAYMAILISIVFVILIGEILPQAYCTGPAQLSIATFMSPVVKTLMCLLSPLTIPIAKYLDWLLGTDHANRYQKEDLKTMIELHEHQDGLHPQEIEMIVQTIDLRDSLASSLMTPIQKVFMLHSEQTLTPNLVKALRDKGFSKVPIFNKQHPQKVLGVLKTKSLVNATPDRRSILQTFSTQPPLMMPSNVTVLDLLLAFQNTKTTVALLTEFHYHPPTDVIHVIYSQAPAEWQIDPQLNQHALIGLVSLKDIFELLIQKDLEDEDELQAQPAEVSMEDGDSLKRALLSP